MAIPVTDELREADEIIQNQFSKRKQSRLKRIEKANEYRKECNKRRAEATEIRINNRRARREKRQQRKKDRPRSVFSILATRYFVVGFLCISFSVILSVIWGPNGASSFKEATKDIFCKVLSTIGVAIMLGAIFDFSKGSDAFLHIVSDILSDIVVSKNFLKTLSDKDKESALELIIKPPDNQIEHYSNINALYAKTIHEIMNLYDINFKTNVTLSVVAYRDEEKNCVCCDTVFIQTIYKIGAKFKPIEVKLEKENSKLEFVVLPPFGEGEKVQGKTSTVSSGGITYTVYTFDIPEEYQKYDHLMLKRTASEPGHTNWINFYWQTVTPCEGLICTIDCEDGLKVKDFMIFDDKAFYAVDKTDEDTHLEITSAQWLNIDTGFVVTISGSSFLSLPPSTEIGQPNKEIVPRG